MRHTIRAYAAEGPGQPLRPFEYSPEPLDADYVEIRVMNCGICHSDISMLHNEWAQSHYPLIPGHEAIGTVVQAGSQVKNLKVGDVVGVGWYAGSCMACPQCLSGNHNLCPNADQTIVGRHGAFAEKVRCHWAWALPLPVGLDPAKAGPLFCGGATVFTPIVEFAVKPTDRVGVVGVGGLGHLALQFLNKWGCEVWAFSSSPGKKDELLGLGAHHVVNSRSPGELSALAGTLDFLLVTVNVPLDWSAYINALAPKGRLHLVGAVLEPIPVAAFSLIGGQKSISGSPVANPTNLRLMLDFCARHQIAPIVERFPMSRANDALEHLRSGKPRYRIVLDADF
jgi:uncharacterized zinc-type alcohol dehydrogenase-like protein